MNRIHKAFSAKGFNPPVRRVLALDAGSRRMKMLLAETDFGRFRSLKEELIDLKTEGLVSAEELKAHLHNSLEMWGNPPVALVPPEHLSTAQILDLPKAPASDVEKLIAEETVKLSGVTESRVVYDFYRLEDPTQDKQKFWVTRAQEPEVRERILRLGLEREELAEVTTTTSSLFAAYRAAAPLSSRAILVHLGAQSTAVLILIGGQPAFASSFQMGGDFFTRAIAREQQVAEPAAESLKREQNLLSGSAISRALLEAVEGWVAELKRQLNDWFEENPTFAAEVRSFALVASGGGFEQKGLLEYLKAEAALEFMRWPKPERRDAPSPGSGFEVAFGAALLSLGHGQGPVSLLPEDYRTAWRKRLTRERIEVISFLLLSICVLLLALGTWRKMSLYSTRKELWTKVQAAQNAVEANEALSADLAAGYENLRPIAAGNQNTLDTLKSLTLLQQSCSKSNLWYVLIADQQSYFSRSAAALQTNRPAKTNLLGPSLEALRLVPLVPRAFYGITNAATAIAKPGLIAELCIPGAAEASRQTLSELVYSWKQQPMFSKVDLLSEDLRRNLADPKIIVPERDYVLSLDFAESDFQQPVRLKKTTPLQRGARRGARPYGPVGPSDIGNGNGQTSTDPSS